MVPPEDAGVVAAHFVRDAALRIRLPAAGHDVDVVVVEQNPDIGSLDSGLPVVRLRLDELRRGWSRGVDGLVQLTVHAQRFGHPDGAYGGASLRVPFDRRAGTRDGHRGCTGR
jgi:hypothetical protein